jgi:hypothetical protein
MGEKRQISEPLKEIIARQPAMKEAHSRANRKALLEHARMGRSVPEGSRDGSNEVVWITPAEIFARYGLDEFGRELATADDQNHQHDLSDSKEGRETTDQGC